MKSLPHCIRFLSVAGVLALLTACTTTPAPAFSGRWKPVNRFAEQTQAIPLRSAYAYYAAPVDRTLKSLLERWARDSRMELDYRHDSDFTLHRPVADVHSDDLKTALAQLTALYAAERVDIAIDGSRIVVRRADATPTSRP
ncbi:hypothetical protein [Lysobacter xanthus]